MATIPTGRFVWFDYLTTDEKKAQAFFGELFNWKTKEVATPKGSHSMIAVGDQTIGGYMTPPQGAPKHTYWLSHLQVVDAQATVKKVKELGGKIVKEPFKIPDEGTMAIVVDPLGGTFALWQPLNAEKAGGDYKGVDGTWIWNELYTQDQDKSLAFYKGVGGFESEMMKTEAGEPGPVRYELLKADGVGRAGIMKLRDIPQMWMPYVKVANTDATVEKAKRLGADIKMPAESVSGVGRLAVLLDPFGAPIGILQPQPK